MASNLAKPTKTKLAAAKPKAASKSASQGKRPAKRKKLPKGVLGTVVIDGVEVQIFKPVGRGTIPVGEIRKAIAAVRKEQKEKATSKTGE